MWKILGIAPTTDAREIRRAYAQKLRALGRDPGAQAFQALRRAYENALYHAEHHTAVAEDDDADVDVEALIDPDTLAELLGDEAETEDLPDAAPQPVVAPPAPDAPKDPPPSDVPDTDAAILARAVDAALQARRYADAFAAYDRGLASGAFAFGMREFFADRIMGVVMLDRAVPPDALAGFVRRLGWDTLPGRDEPVSRVRRSVVMRMEAEAWYAALVALAQEGRRPPERGVRRAGVFARWQRRRLERRNARILLGRRALLLITQAADEDLRRQRNAYAHYAAWLGNRIPQDVLERTDRLLMRDDSWSGYVRNAIWVAFVVLLLGTVAALSAADQVPQGAFLLVVGVRMAYYLFARWRARRPD